VAPTLAEARANAYAGAAPIEWDGLQYRSDIALDVSGAAEERVG
jgi:phosphoribosylamine-glycine ligase